MFFPFVCTNVHHNFPISLLFYFLVCLGFQKYVVWAPEVEFFIEVCTKSPILKIGNKSCMTEADFVLNIKNASQNISANFLV
jgi:hypothetical protein